LGLYQSGCSSAPQPDERGGVSTSALGSFNVLTRGYDNTGARANVSETILTVANVHTPYFRKLFKMHVDDRVYAQILYASAVTISGTSQNVVYVLTANNTLYAFNADTGSFISGVNFNGAYRPPTHSEVGDVPGKGGDPDFPGNVGAISTPVIDGTTGTMYLVTHTLENGAGVFRLRALDMTTGNDRAGSPVVITARGFNPQYENQRASLALFHGSSQTTVYFGFGAYADGGPWHGWLMAYDATTLAQTGTFNSTPTGLYGGIWQSGAAPAIDSSGYVYVATGNGDWDGVKNFGESVIRLAPRTLTVASFFTPYNWSNLNSADFDLGVTGPTLLPGSNTWLAQGSKEGKVYFLQNTALGGIHMGSDSVYWFQATHDTCGAPCNGDGPLMFSGTVLWNSPSGLNVYAWGQGDYPRDYRVDPTHRTSVAQPAAAQLRSYGGSMSLSSNGSQVGTGILWATTPVGVPPPQNSAQGPGVLYALRAEYLPQTLYSSSNLARDATGWYANFNPPVVANGKVYVPAFVDASGSTDVYAYGTVPATTVGIFRPANTPNNHTTEGQWLLRNSNSDGGPDSTFYYGGQSDIPVVGDWTGSGVTTIGVFRPANTPDNPTTQGQWLLRNSNTPGSPDINFYYGAPGDIPVVGDWTGSGVTAIGVFRPANTPNNSDSRDLFLLRNSNTPGPPDFTVYFGPSGASNDIPVTGDWIGGGITAVGVFRQANNTNNPTTQGQWLLRYTNTTGDPDNTFYYGAPGDLPVAGSWTRNGKSTVGVFRDANSAYNMTNNSQFLLRNANGPGSPDIIVNYAALGGPAVVGGWKL
jgi:hypothetical protein